MVVLQEFIIKNCKIFTRLGETKGEARSCKPMNVLTPPVRPLETE